MAVDKSASKSKKKAEGAGASAAPRSDLIVALDFPTGEAALATFRKLQGLPVIYKIGSELFTATGPAWIKERIREGARVFLDLKFHDIPNTVAKAAAKSAELGIEMFTLHLAGGPKMIQAVRDELEKNSGPAPKVLGVSVLTSFDAPTWDEVTFALAGQSSPIQDSVQRLVMQARYWGCDGVVCSPHELKRVKAADPLLYSVVPGIRPRGSAPGDQARVMTPIEAAKLGARAIVVGRPITEAPDPRAMAEKILKSLSTAPLAAN